jgi:hypothetical protein
MEGGSAMAIGRAERRGARKSRVVATFGDTLADPILDLLELTEFAWHDCYGEITPSEEMVDDILLCSKGDLTNLIRIARLAITDWRDVRAAADEIRAAQKSN